VKSNLTLALEAYMKSEDPYAWYRIGQSFEEGWTTEPDIDKAMPFYRKAAAVGHHLALKRLECEEE
jgi:TPR repeat protein